VTRLVLRNRWWVIALVGLGTVLNYLARSTLSTVAPTLKAQFAMTTEQYSYVVMAFQAAYTVGQPLAGMALDVLGSRVGMALFAAIWAIANMAHALAGGWQGLAMARAGLGMAEASAMPGGLKVVADWFAPKQRSVATGWFNMGASLGNMIAPPLVAFCVICWGWRSSFLVTGGLSLLWAGLWFALYRDPARAQASGRPKARWGSILGQRDFWAIAVPRFLAEPAWQTFSFWIPLYLAKERGMDLTHIALFAWMPFLAADAGGILGGYLAPFLRKWRGLSLEGSRIAGVALGAVLMIAPGFVGIVGHPMAAIALLAIGGFAHQVISVLINTLSADVFPKGDIAKANGLVGMAGWTGGLLFSLAIGQLADKIGFAPLFACLGVFDLIGAIWLFAMRRHLIVKEA
jgi:ACS family hexuronate transporter-like MFS transporter